MELAGIEAARLPPLVNPHQVAGGLSAVAAGILGLPEGLPVVPGATDGVLANLGAGAAGDGQAAITVGTSGAVRIARRHPALDAHARTWSYVLIPGRFICGGAINNGGLTMKWLRQRFYAGTASGDAYELMMHEAAAIEPGAEGLFILPYFAGERCPHWRQDARAVMAGLGMHHTRGHLARAGAESVAFCLADVIEAVQAKIVPPVRLTGGITASRLWCGIVADVLGLAIQPVYVADASAVGAAILGHLALGHIDAIDGVQPRLQSPIIAPDGPRHRRYRELHDRWRALQPVALRGD
jgi:gluconokinase